MPPIRRPRRNYRRRYTNRRTRRVGASLSTTRWSRRKRVTQGLTRNVVWFKRVQAITSDTAGNLGFSVTSDNVGSIDDFITYGTLYSQYKVLKVISKFFPSNVGGESQQLLTPGAGLGFPLLQRGDALTYTGKHSLTSTSIPDLIVRPSARLIQPRRYHKRWTDRPKGYPIWGELDTTGIITQNDAWDDESGIHLIGENFTPTQAPGQQNYFYVLSMWKVLFRSRKE